MSSEQVTKREKRIAAREDRKRRATDAQKTALAFARWSPLSWR